MNLCLLTKDEQLEIERDKQQWFKAHKMLNSKNTYEIRQYLTTLDDDEREDFRRRLNKIREKK